MPPERRNELVARYIVSEALGRPVRRFEDGTANSQVDAEILLSCGEVAALEIVSDQDQDFNSQWDAMSKLDHRVPVSGLTRRWTVSLTRNARINDIKKHLPALMLRLDRNDISWPRWGAPPAFARLGVRHAYPLDGDPDGVVHLTTEGWSGVAGSGEISAWITDMLTQHEDVVTKLARHPASSKHAFIWVTIGSEYSVQDALEDRGQPLPEITPELPSAVTHVWIAGSFTSQGVLAWFPDRGWWRPWSWPPEPLAIPDGF